MSRAVPSLRPATRYVLIPARETLPTAAREFKDQLSVLRGTPDSLWVCVQTAGTTYEWKELTGPDSWLRTFLMMGA